MEAEAIVSSPQSIQEKWCSRCKEAHPFSAFGKDRSAPDGMQHVCKVRIADYSRKVRAERGRRRPSTQENKRGTLKKRFGITLEHYTTMLQAQHEVCAICGEPETRANQHGVIPLSVDHDHQTGQVRGLLCTGCNLRLGHFEFIMVNQWFTEAASSYLARFRSAEPSLLNVQEG